MSGVDKVYRFGWSGGLAGRKRSGEQEEAITVARNLLAQAQQIDALIPVAHKAGLQQAKARVRRAALDLLFLNHAEPELVVEVLHDLAFDEAEAGFWTASREAAADTVAILLQFHETLQAAPEFGFSQRVQNMSALLAELKGLSE